MVTLNQAECCGVKEVDGIMDVKQTASKSLKELADDFFNDEMMGGYIYFTDIKNSRKGGALANLIKRKKLGKVVKLPATINPNSRNRLKMWVWVVDQHAFRRWAEREEITHRSECECDDCDISFF